jgi:hypothetical protein
MATLHKVTALIDWDTARRIVPTRSITSLGGIEIVFEKLQDAIARHIVAGDKRGAYRVNWRVYHGWHRGRTKTPDRISFEKFLVAAKARTVGNISFSGDYAFSEVLCCESNRGPVIDTLRFDSNTNTDRQKMVDTLLVCDLLHLVRTGTARAAQREGQALRFAWPGRPRPALVFAHQIPTN